MSPEKVEGALLSPNGSTRHWNNPFCVQKCCLVAVLLSYRHLPISTGHIERAEPLCST